MMSYPVSSHIQYRLTEQAGGTLLKFTHRAFGFIEPGLAGRCQQGLGRNAEASRGGGRRDQLRRLNRFHHVHRILIRPRSARSSTRTYADTAAGLSIAASHDTIDVDTWDVRNTAEQHDGRDTCHCSYRREIAPKRSRFGSERCCGQPCPLDICLNRKGLNASLWRQAALDFQ